MGKQLLEITKGIAKGLVGTICTASIMGLPTADGVYKTIKSKSGKIAYGIVNAALFVSAFAALYSIGN